MWLDLMNLLLKRKLLNQKLLKQKLVKQKLVKLMKSQHLRRETVSAPSIVGRKHGKGGPVAFVMRPKMWLDLINLRLKRKPLKQKLVKQKRLKQKLVQLMKSQHLSR